jgi:hypothetical protein
MIEWETDHPVKKSTLVELVAEELVAEAKVPECKGLVVAEGMGAVWLVEENLAVVELAVVEK